MLTVSPADLKDQLVGSSGFLCRYSCTNCDQNDPSKSYHLPEDGSYSCETGGVNGRPSLVNGIIVGSSEWDSVSVSGLKLVLADPLDYKPPYQEFHVYDYPSNCASCASDVTYDSAVMCQ